MIILRGQRQGKTGTIRQYASDRFTADLDDGTRGVDLCPSMVRLIDGADWALFSDENVGASIHLQIRDEWRLTQDGWFTAIHRVATGPDAEVPV